MSQQISLGELMRRQRATLGLTQARLAELIGRSPSTVRSWERDRAIPGDDAAYSALAAVLGLTEDEIEAAVGGRFADPSDRAQLAEGAAAPEHAGSGEAEELMSDERQGIGSAPPDQVERESTGPEPGETKSSSAADDTVRNEVASSPAPATGAVSRPARVPSYLDDPAEVRTYRTRSILTAILLILMFIVLAWAFGEARDALGSLFGDPAL